MQGAIDAPKPLALVNHEPLLLRTLRQLHENGVKDSIVVTGYRAQEVESCAKELFPETRFVRNSEFAEDRNILSTILGLRAVPAGNRALLLEGDVVFSEQGLARLVNPTSAEENFWAACGPFQTGQKGGIIRAEGDRIVEIRYADWSPALEGWHKNLGAIHICASSLASFIEIAEEYATQNTDQYFMTPWLEHLDRLPARLLDLGQEASSFNTPAEYARSTQLFTVKMSELPIHLAAVRDLSHVEDYDRQRAEWLAKKIAEEGIWKRPVIISRENIVMDGQHRLEAARQLGLNRIPAIMLDYHEIPVFSLRPEIALDADSIIANVNSGNLYPYKTVKHEFPAFPDCQIPLDELGFQGENS